MQRVIFNQLSPLHPFFMLHRAIAPTLLPPSHFIFIFILSLVTGGGDNRCKAKLWVAYPPFSCSISALFNKKTAPSSFHLFPLVFLLLCLSDSLSLSFLWPFICLAPPPPPSLVVFLLTSHRGFPARSFLLLAAERQMYSRQPEITQMCNTVWLSCGTVAHGVLLVPCLVLMCCVYDRPPATLDPHLQCTHSDFQEIHKKAQSLIHAEALCVIELLSQSGL